MNVLEKRGSFVNNISIKSKNTSSISESTKINTRDLNFFRSQIGQSKLNTKK